MRFHFALIPVFDSGQAEAELNKFLGSHRVVGTDRELLVDGQRSAWAVCVSYDENAPVAKGGGKSRIDYREVLPDDEFQVFARLRSLRKDMAEKEGVPAYALFTNEQLAQMVNVRAKSAADLAEIDGVGKARIQKTVRRPPVDI